MAQQGACVRCGAANVNGWLQEGQSFCCEKCWTCLLCGSLRKKALWPAQPHRFPSCRRCEEKSKQLSSEAKDLLLAIDALQFDFVIWSTVNGRPMKLKDPPFAQPAEAGEGLLIGDFSDVQAACLQARGVGAVLDLSGRGSAALAQELKHGVEQGAIASQTWGVFRGSLKGGHAHGAQLGKV